ncbi:DUF5683 domain-containing protein [Flavobacterium psychrotolerans]|uniref:DUF5683 domain-containing protein n=1 Tax=Flavobacterium psychrotolerans TaxID=2169410 RepID=UPI00140BB7F8|nr:DUF5683 domain-containing protein [Flavobacterium psychrotolerans]
MLKYIAIILFLFGNTLLFGQVKTDPILTSKDTIKSQEINPLAPAKAAFYSAILPGLGQAYNKKYWKIPLVYGAIGTTLYFYSLNNTKYHEFRDAYKSRLAGNPNEKYSYLDDTRLITAQRFYQRNRDLSLLLTAGFYILNIVDANVDAHLLQFNVNDNLSLNPKLDTNEINFKPNFGLALNYTF